ncbi:hypothetical protein ACWKW4_04705 [Hydrogenophaga borbori]
MADGPTNSQLDLSAGDDPYAPYSKKANELLDDAVSRRRYRGASFFLAVAVVLFFGLLLYKLACAIASYVTSFSPWVVGMFATLVVAMSVITLALLKATFAAPNGSTDDSHELPQMAVISDSLKALSDAIAALRASISK